MPTSQEIAALRRNVINSFGDASTLSQLGQMGGHLGPIAQMGPAFTMEDKGAVFLCAMLDEFFRVSPDQNIYRGILERANGYVDRDNRTGGRAWSEVRTHLLSIGRANGWSTLDTLYDDWTPDQRRQFNAMIEGEAPKKSGGCYVATAVYGSYDCPEVWVLRRFRDNSLMTTQLGRWLVRAYYAVSPRAVRFGGAPLRALSYPPLAALVAVLRNRGVADTPYFD